MLGIQMKSHLLSFQSRETWEMLWLFPAWKRCFHLKCAHVWCWLVKIRLFLTLTFGQVSERCLQFVCAKDTRRRRRWHTRPRCPPDTVSQQVPTCSSHSTRGSPGCGRDKQPAHNAVHPTIQLHYTPHLSSTQWRELKGDSFSLNSFREFCRQNDQSQISSSQNELCTSKSGTGNCALRTRQAKM